MCQGVVGSMGKEPRPYQTVCHAAASRQILLNFAHAERLASERGASKIPCPRRVHPPLSAARSFRAEGSGWVCFRCPRRLQRSRGTRYTITMSNGCKACVSTYHEQQLPYLCRCHCCRLFPTPSCPPTHITSLRTNVRCTCACQSPVDAMPTPADYVPWSCWDVSITYSYAFLQFCLKCSTGDRWVGASCFIQGYTCSQYRAAARMVKGKGDRRCRH